MIERRFTMVELVTMHRITFDCLRVGALRLAGIPWTKWWEAWRDPATGELVIRYE